jgi:hypothetical protein
MCEVVASFIWGGFDLFLGNMYFFCDNCCDVWLCYSKEI